MTGYARSAQQLPLYTDVLVGKGADANMAAGNSTGRGHRRCAATAPFLPRRLRRCLSARAGGEMAARLWKVTGNTRDIRVARAARRTVERLERRVLLAA